jgi:hypothetical protein
MRYCVCCGEPAAVVDGQEKSTCGDRACNMAFALCGVDAPPEAYHRAIERERGLRGKVRAVEQLFAKEVREAAEGEP